MNSLSASGRSMVGSPPRARGHARRPHGRNVVRRFTPACAGTCTSTTVLCMPGTVHPRVRGDMVGRPLSIVIVRGSPPRARGHGDGVGVGHGVFRFTPACAGTCRTSRGSSRQRSVHPRVRGDMGLDRLRNQSRPRFTPACAGTCSVSHPSKPSTAVHPRVRGDMSMRSTSR